MASYPKAKVKYIHMHMCIKTMQGQGQNRMNKTHNVDITLISVQLFAFIKRLLPVHETDRGDNDRKFVAFGKKKYWY